MWRLKKSSMIVSALLTTCMCSQSPKAPRPDFYISGPMRGLPGLNFEAFNRCAADLRARGYTCLNPAEQDVDAGYLGVDGKIRPWLDCILQDAEAVLRAKQIVLLPGWEKSKGTRAEIMIKLGEDKPDPFSILKYHGYGKPMTICSDPLKEIVTHLLPMAENSEVRSFSTGATRSSDTGKPDYEGFLSPVVLEEFGKYMSKHRIQANGEPRDSDNWQRGIPLSAYIKSTWRHFMHWWLLHRGHVALDEKGQPVTMRETLSAIMFNTMGYFHEWLKEGEKDVVPLAVRSFPPRDYQSRSIPVVGKPS